MGTFRAIGRRNLLFGKKLMDIRLSDENEAGIWCALQDDIEQALKDGVSTLNISVPNLGFGDNRDDMWDIEIVGRKHDMSDQQDYYGTKRITAWPKNDELSGDPGYAVRYSDKYISWSPKDVFEAAYQPIDAMNFGHALAAMNNNHRVARAGWNGKGMWIWLVLEHEYEVDGYLNYITAPFIAMKTVDDTIVPWLCSQTDLLSNDWCIIL